MHLNNRFYLFGQFIGNKLGARVADDAGLGTALGSAIFFGNTPEATILQAQLFLVGNSSKFQELMGLAREGARNPKDTSNDLYLDQMDEMELAAAREFVENHGGSGFDSVAARDRIEANLNRGSFASKAAYASFYIHRYTISLESKESVIATFEGLHASASDSRSKEYWNILKQIVQSLEPPTGVARLE